MAGAAQNLSPTQASPLLASSGFAPSVAVTVRAAEGVGQPVRIDHFTPRLAAAAALAAPAVGAGDDARDVLALGARWDEVIESALGFEASLSFSGAVALDARTHETQGLALGATVGALGVDLSGRYAQRDGGADDRLSFGAAMTSGLWTLGGAVSLALEGDASGANPGASVEASYALTPGLRVGGVVAFGEDTDARAATPDAASVSAGMSLRLDF